MHSLLNSLRKRLYTARLTSARCRRQWGGDYSEEADGIVSVACRRCPKYSSRRNECTVPFGSALRKCTTASQEAHLHSLDGMRLLEIGFGKHSIPRRLVTTAGGTWTGIDPWVPADQEPQIGSACRGHVAAIPFDDATFDIVVGVQTLEHWADPLPGGEPAPGYEKSLAEVHRVLKPGASIYFDAPIHLHGHEMFVAGDIERIRSRFDADHWDDVTIEAWRRDFEPLERYPTPAVDSAGWTMSVSSYSRTRLDEIRDHGSVWLLVVTARKR